MSDPVGFATVDISPELIRQALHMPDDTAIIGAAMFHSCVRLVVCAPGLPGAFGEEPPPVVEPTVTRKPEEFVWDWRLPS